MTIAAATDPAPDAAGVVTGFRYAIAGAALLGVLGVLVALRIKEPPKTYGNFPGPQ